MNEFLRANSNTRIESRDAFMLMALWMEQFPGPTPLTSNDVNPTGCVLVSPSDRIVSLKNSGESHAIVRAIQSATVDTHGCTLFVSRLPCSLCTKVMAQAGIQKCFYFPADKCELVSEVNRTPLTTSPSKNGTTTYSKQERDQISAHRLITNNSIGLSIYIPHWSRLDDTIEYTTSFDAILNNPTSMHHSFITPSTPLLWTLDASLGRTSEFSSRWDRISSRFTRTSLAIQYLQSRYSVTVQRQNISNSQIIEDLPHQPPPIAHHAMVLAHLAARKTDDRKVGVGAVIVKNGTYTSVGWNGYPRNAQNLDYPQFGADETEEDLELKYNYILHAEQNALLWRNPPGCELGDETFLVSTKCPCDECSPMVHDTRIKTVYTNRQSIRDVDDPLRYRGLSYEKCHVLLDTVYVFNVKD